MMGMAVASAGPKQSARHSWRISTPTPHHSIFTGRMLFLAPTECRSTEGNNNNNNSNSNNNSGFIYIACFYEKCQTHYSRPMYCTVVWSQAQKWMKIKLLLWCFNLYCSLRAKGQARKRTTNKIPIWCISCIISDRFLPHFISRWFFSPK